MTCIMQSSKKTLDTWEAEKLLNTSLAAKGALTACNAAPPAKSKMAASGPQNGRRGLDRCLPLGFGAF